MVYAACKDGLLSHYRVPSRPGRRGKYVLRETDVLTWLEGYRHEAGDVEDDGPLRHVR